MLCAFFTQMWRWTFPNRKLFFFGVIRISAEPFVSHFYRKNMKTKYFNRQYLTAFGSNTPTIRQCDLFLFILFHSRNLFMYFTICVIMKVYEFFSLLFLFSHSFLLFTTTKTCARAFQCIGILQAGSTMAHAHTDNSGWVVISVPSIQPKHTRRFNVLERYIRHGIYI